MPKRKYSTLSDLYSKDKFRKETHLLYIAHEILKTVSILGC